MLKLISFFKPIKAAICFLLFLPAFLLSACVTTDHRIANPKASDIAGLWESTSVLQYTPYTLLRINPNGDGVWIAVNEEQALEVLTFTFVKTWVREFEVRITSSIREEAQPIHIRGSLAQGQLCFDVTEIPDKENHKVEIPSLYQLCFTQYKAIDEYRAKALKLLGSKP